MQKKTMVYGALAIAGMVAVYFAWKFTARNAYESAPYKVVESQGPFEIRDYPDLQLATTDMAFAGDRSDGSFMRLFRYISGSNDAGKKIAMTTPVFMGDDTTASQPTEMGFVLPQDLADGQIPQPTQEGVRIETRPAGRFAVVRFAGRLDRDAFAEAETRLKTWLDGRGLTTAGAAEGAGYDPPWTPGPLRRNEVLFRLAKDT